MCAGVLRNVVRMRASNSVPSPSEEEGSAADALAIAASHPTWMVERWLERYGRDSTMQLLAANNRWELQAWLLPKFCTQLCSHSFMAEQATLIQFARQHAAHHCRGPHGPACAKRSGS